MSIAHAHARDPGVAAVRITGPNDLMLHARKLGGILIAARWRGGEPEWVAIGVGINIADPPSGIAGIGIGGSASWHGVAKSVIPAIRRAAAASGQLTEAELASFRLRDWAAGRACVEPVSGTVQGIDGAGRLLVASEAGVMAVSAGSLILADRA
jgi:BirA family biotin operon repressor/biotin-[acetyl-CoA-carboxylase] ligase